MEFLIAGSAIFVLSHLGVSGTPLRGWLQKALGESPYLGLYSLVSFASLGLMIYGYILVPHSDFLWLPSVAAYKVTKVLLLLSIVLLVMGTMVKNPTQVMNDKALDEELAGLLKITRHPIQWAILLYAVGHLIANGDVASIWLFGSLAVVALFGMFAMDARKRREPSEKWQRFMETTSMFPFAAILQGRTQLKLSELNWATVIAGLGVYAAIYWLHNMVSGGVSLF